MTEEERLLLEARVRSGKSVLMKTAAAVLARAGRKVTIVRAGGQKTEILPFKRPQPRTMETE